MFPSCKYCVVQVIRYVIRYAIRTIAKNIMWHKYFLNTTQYPPLLKNLTRWIIPELICSSGGRHVFVAQQVYSGNTTKHTYENKQKTENSDLKKINIRNMLCVICCFSISYHLHESVKHIFSSNNISEVFCRPGSGHFPDKPTYHHLHMEWSTHILDDSWTAEFEQFLKLHLEQF